MSAHVMEHCVVHGAMAALLRVMRVVGLMPVRLVPRSGTFVVRYSFAQDVIARLFYGCYGLLLIALELLYLIRRILDDQPMTNILMFVSLVFSVIIRTSVIFFAVLKGYQRIKQLCKNLNILQKLNIEGLQDVSVANVEKRRYKLFISLLLISPIINLIEVIIDKEYFTMSKVTCLYLIRKVLNQFGLIAIVKLQGEFVFAVLSVHTSLQALNRRLGKMLRDFKTIKSNNNETIETHRTLRKLATTYVTLCDVMRRLDKESRLMVFMALILQLLYATQCTFFIILFWNTNPSTNIPYEGLELEKLSFNRILQCCRCLHVVITIMFLLEPCQWTYNEMEVTRLFVTRLTHYASSVTGPIVNELEILYRLVFTYIPEYKPLQLITLKRAFILELFGALAGWMIIVLHDRNK